jgi:hypothetical protein
MESVWVCNGINRHEVRFEGFRKVFRLLVTANIVPSLLIPVNLAMEAIPSSETSVITRATRRNMQKTAFSLTVTKSNDRLSMGIGVELKILCCTKSVRRELLYWASGTD